MGGHDLGATVILIGVLLLGIALGLGAAAAFG